MRKAVIVSAARTPIGSFNGVLSSLAATQLGSIAIAAALKRARLSGEKVDEVIMGNVLSAGLGQAPARQAGLGAGLPESVGCTTVSKVCGSGLKAVIFAAQAIVTGDADVIVAGGMESMSNAPYLLPQARSGYRLGHGEVVDSMIKDGLWDVYNQFHMGKAAELCAEKSKISRQDQDQFAAASYRRALSALEKGEFKREIVPVAVPQRSEKELVVEEDEEPKRVRFEKLPTLKPSFKQGGTVTAGNASSISDGAAALVVMEEGRATAQGLKPIARIVACASFATEPAWFTTAPIQAISGLLRKAELGLADIDLFEINEAFAVCSIAINRELGLNPEKVNIRGGAVAMGHPIGASGARILTTLLHALEDLKLRRGVASLCIGGGEALAMLVERE
ncbi:MAG: acetyl-CoA acetyltransferase [Deltaproteobacteria bacterium GWA2_57_13]|nr:MAG: acetyl-CoA acetyltransferase [Deltaproteobacteria bacterium GWA2_57_13]OGQ51916.1 MAG: acetyl-CoA acetyltransferase [Deltaproteobacteria bacterium RIFCSPLOWO2_02_FULL_57_26]OGQ81900.1 MAG: acetyl-CoA acetyltransferase [Deltaproteobacteria bacterium RIFCSPLOWO2_12_FULL_57_22]